MFDTHIHTKFSSDSKMTIEEVMEQCKSLGIGAVITEHMDLNYPIEGIAKFDVKEYFNEYGVYRNENLLLGIELGMHEDYVEENKKILDSGDFDQVIGSLHFVGNFDLFEKSSYEGREKSEVYRKYLEGMYLMLEKYRYIDVLGHIDYICRYVPYEDKEIHYKDYSDEIDSILKECIEEGIAFELNTRRIGDKVALENLYKIYKRYRELGGKYITLGSDAHNKSAIYNNFDVAKDLAEDLNLKIVYFRNRNMQYV